MCILQIMNEDQRIDRAHGSIVIDYSLSQRNKEINGSFIITTGLHAFQTSTKQCVHASQQFLKRMLASN